MAPSLGPGLFGRPVNKLCVDPVQRDHALLGLGAQPFAQGGLVGPGLESEQAHEHLVLAHALGVGQPGPATCQRKQYLGDNGRRAEARALSFSRIQQGLVLNALPEVEAPTEGVDENLTAVSGGLIGVG